MIASNANGEHTPITSCVNYLRTVDGPVLAQHSITLCYFNSDINGGRHYIQGKEKHSQLTKDDF